MKNKHTHYLYNFPKEANRPNTSNDKDKSFFCNDEVAMGCYKPIKARFQMLFDLKKIIQQNLADALGLDKGYISRIVNGLEIPPHHVRIKISAYFSVDSTSIWRIEDLPYIKKILKQQEERK